MTLAVAAAGRGMRLQPVPRSATGIILTIAAGLVAGLLLVAPAAAQTIIPATKDLTCLGARHGTTMGCTANDFTVAASFSAAPGTPAYCTAGDVFYFDAELDVTSSNSQRYDVGFFVGQQGNSPELATGGNICTVATFPKTPAPFMDADGNACGDFAKSSEAFPRVTGIKVVCASSSGSNLNIPYVLSYNQNGTTCTSAADVMAGSKSKCSSNIATLDIDTVLGSNPVLVGGYIDVTKQTTPDGDSQLFSYTATGPSGSKVGVEIAGVSYNNFGDNVVGNPATEANDNTYTFQLGDGQTARVFMSVIPVTTRRLIITEAAATHWQPEPVINCTTDAGSPIVSSDNAARRMQADLNTVDKGAKCTITNTKRARISLREQVGGRLFAADQFQFSVSGAGAATLTDASGAAIASPGLVTVTTDGAGTGNFSNTMYPSFRATPGQSLTLATAMAAGSTSTAASYATTLTCTNAFSGPGATTSLPNAQVRTSYALVPAPGDDITCTYAHGPRALLTLAKVVVNNDGLTSVANDWTLSATGPTSISGKMGNAAVTAAPVTPGTYTLSESGPAAYLRTSLVCSGAADTDPSDGLALVASENVTCTFTNDDQQVAQTLVKSNASLELDADGSGTITPGDTLAYTVTMTNTGISTLTNVQVTDAQLSPASQSCASVVTAASCVLHATRLVTAADATAGEIVNTASVVSNQIPGPVPSNTVTTPVQAPPAPALKVVKSHSGNFFAGSDASYTLQVSNIGLGSITGTTTVTDTLDPDLGFVSASGLDWVCGVAGTPQVVTCTSSQAVASFSNMAPITLTVSVDPGIGSSVDNVASVANTTINVNTPVPGNTDTATVLYPDLHTSTKTVVNLGGGSSADVDAGDVLQYTINVIESAGAIASDVRVTDTVPSGLGSLVVTQFPLGASNNSSGSLVDISGITVPANGTVQVKFQVTVGGGFSPGDSIINTAQVDNPGGPDATPVSPTLTYGLSQIVSDDDKLLYLHSGGVLNRIPQSGLDTTGTPIGSPGSDWSLTTGLASHLLLTAGVIDVTLSLSGNSTVSVQLWDGATQIGSTSPSQSVSSGTAVLTSFQITLGTAYDVAAGHVLTLRVVTSGNLSVYEFNVGASLIAFKTSTVVNVDSVDAYSEAFASGSAKPDYFLPGETAYLRVVASDPFGGTDVSASDSWITVTDPNGAVVAGPMATMSMVDTTTANRTLEYVVPIPASGPLGTWTATVAAYEGTEETIHHTVSATFEVRGLVTLDQAWGSNAVDGDAVDLQVVGGSDAIDGSSTAPGSATPATAAATPGSTITLVQAFTSGTAGTYSIGLSCARDADAAVVVVSGAGLSRQIQMPLDSSVTCTWVDAATVAPTIVKSSTVKSDPVNGAVNPKAIPGAVVEYQLLVTNPGPIPLDSGSTFITDPLPSSVDMRVADLSAPGAGPITFANGTPSSGLTYTFTSLDSTTDDVEFSNNNGLTWDYAPSDPDLDGIDPQVTDIRINPKGAFNGNNGNFTLRFRTRLN